MMVEVHSVLGRSECWGGGPGRGTGARVWRDHCLPGGTRRGQMVGYRRLHNSLLARGADGRAVETTRREFDALEVHLGDGRTVLVRDAA